MDKRTDKHTNEQTKVPLCSTGLCPLGAAVQKKTNYYEQTGKQTDEPSSDIATYRIVYTPPKKLSAY